MKSGPLLQYLKGKDLQSTCCFEGRRNVTLIYMYMLFIDSDINLNIIVIVVLHNPHTAFLPDLFGRLSLNITV